MTNPDKYQQIEAYLNHELDGEELEAFEAKLTEDTELQKEVELHQDVQETLKGENIYAFRQILREVNQDWEGPEKKQEVRGGGKIIGLYRWMAVAAAAIAFFLVYTFLIPTSNQPTDLFAANFDPYPMLLNERGGEPDIETAQLSEAIQAYSSGDYQQAIQGFQNLQNANNPLPAYQFYLALSYLANQESEAAIPLFEAINQNVKHAFYEQSQWYLGLAYLQNDDPAKAKEILASIAEGKYQYEAAQRLIQDL